jgi:hypothetical protein
VNRRPFVRPLLAAGAAAAITLLLVGATGVLDTPLSGDPPIGAALREEDRAALAAVPVERGEPAPAVDPRVDMADPAAVARAYLTAAHSVGPQDAGRTQLRAAGYAVPGSPAAAVGVLVLDVPPAGALRTAAVTALDLVAADRDDSRRGYQAEVGTATGPPGERPTVALARCRIARARQPDGRWLVTAETSETSELPAGED